jgi:hypothetical protein
MSFVVGTLLSLVGLLFAILVWQSLPTDGVGRPPRHRRQETGFQGRLTEWLYWDAPLQAPRMKAMGATTQERLGHVGDRALIAVLSRIAPERGVTVQDAHPLLLKEVRAGPARAFLEGRMGRAMRAYWRQRYLGPSFLFLPWYYLVAMVRYGRRHLYLETLASVLQELQRP